jgi:hypothetical protein
MMIDVEYFLYFHDEANLLIESDGEMVIMDM